MAKNEIRSQIQKQLKALKWSRYRLVQAVKGKVPPSCVYSFLAGTRDLSTQYLQVVLGALDLEVTERRPPQAKA